MPLSLFSSYSLSTRIGAILAIIAVFFVVFTGIFSIRHRYRPARYFLISWAGFLVGVTAISLKNFGLVPQIFLTEFGMQIGSSMEVMLLSFALADRINQMKAEMEAPIQAHGGFVDKFIGDAIMALFDLRSDQSNAHSAIKAAISMQKALRVYNRHRANIPYAPISAGIGIHSGEVMIGTLGSSDRMDSTAIGNAVNIASRIQDMTKVYGASVLISDTTLRHLGQTFQYATRMIDRVALSGSSEPVSIFEVFDGDLDKIKDKKLQTQKRFEEAISLYSLIAFEEGIRVMKENLSVFPEDQAALAYVSRCREKLQSRLG